MEGGGGKEREKEGAIEKGVGEEHAEKNVDVEEGA